MSAYRLTMTALYGINKTGNLRPDADGYYTVTVGGLNCVNSVGHIYVGDAAARALFDSSSSLQRRIRDGALRAENGHPDISKMSDNDAIARINHLDQARLCAHFKEIWLGDQLPNGTIPIYAKVIGSGELAHVFDRAVKNPHENLCFSIRAITDNVNVGGRWYKHLRRISTFDLVNEPGIAVAKKWHSPVLEEYCDRDIVLTPARIDAMITAARSDSLRAGLESGSVIASLEDTRAELFRKCNTSIPGYAAW